MYQKKYPRKNREYIENIKKLILQNGKKVINFFKRHSVIEGSGETRNFPAASVWICNGETLPTNAEHQSRAEHLRAKASALKTTFSKELCGSRDSGLGSDSSRCCTSVPALRRHSALSGSILCFSGQVLLRFSSGQVCLFCSRMWRITAAERKLKGFQREVKRTEVVDEDVVHELDVIEIKRTCG